MEKDAEWFAAEVAELQARVWALERALNLVMSHQIAGSAEFGRYIESQERTAAMVSEMMDEPTKLMTQPHDRALALYRELLQSARDRAE
jgi:hypothetical protein